MTSKTLVSISSCFLSSLATSSRLSIVFFIKNGTWRWMEGTATNLLHDPAIQAIVVNFRDTTDRKQLEHQLRFSELKLRSLVESNILGVAVSDGAGRIHEANDRFV